MILAAVFAAVTAMLLLGGPPRVRGADSDASTGASRPVPVVLWRSLFGIGSCLTGALVAGRPGAALGAAGGIVVATVWWTWEKHRRDARRRRERGELRDACMALAAEIETGRVPSAALREVASDHPLLHGTVAMAEMGGSASEGLVQLSASGLGEAAQLAAAWALAERQGASMGRVFRVVAQSLDSDQVIRAAIDAELAAPRATARLLAALPVGGVLLGYSLGGDPVRFLTAEVWGNACLVAGCALAAVGLVWTERLIDGGSGS